MINFLANPERFTRVTRPLRPWLAGLTAIVMVWGLFLAFASPQDYQQGNTVRIMYIHVPSAWMGLSVYAAMGVASFFGLIFRHALADAAARAMAPIGAVFTGLALITGALWGWPMWGTPWQWDGRMTSELVLFLFYIAYIALQGAIEDETKAARMSAILALVGLVNLPIIHFSVLWWNGLHQGNRIETTGAILWPLFVMVAAWHLLFAWLFLVRIDSEILERRYRSLRARLSFN
ncbi:heme ABC transporter permease CcmC [Asticcacaulis sp. EMRT-3]|uniref:heme ABC transporter permease CcmC n=1 Tax=Asticcacaulis sp. EMRT-3 TaxID=3040349 RepID=UPI0024AFBF67|nr:heme ABC transporter permease CcmC [Asticcacaulis sp. EMRT-3]MDI7775432.1 heme ABC transporter permease CcmC [Asticcacaulis sp. EMRT-3]